MKAFWEKYAENMYKLTNSAQRTLDAGTAYLYRVGNTHYEAAFAALISGADGHWKELMQKALKLFERSIETDDCRIKDKLTYPLNQAAMLRQWYLGQWLLNGAANPELLTQSINLYVDGLWAKKQTPLSSFVGLISAYILAGEAEKLKELWQLLGSQADLKRMPSDVAFWYDISNLYLEQSPVTAEQFWQIVAVYQKKLTDPTKETAGFYLSTAKIALDVFKISPSLLSLLEKLTQLKAI